MLAQGVRVAILGRLNVGKSSLLNALLGDERAIVTPIAGTTRDTVEERAILGGVAVHLVDTAGLTETNDPIERIGVQRSRSAAREADLLLLVIDSSAGVTRDDRDVAKKLRVLRAEDAAVSKDSVESTPMIVVEQGRSSLGIARGRKRIDPLARALGAPPSGRRMSRSSA